MLKPKTLYSGQKTRLRGYRHDDADRERALLPGWSFDGEKHPDRSGCDGDSHQPVQHSNMDFICGFFSPLQQGRAPTKQVTPVAN